MRTVNVEPDWSRMFDNAVVQVKAVVDKNDMQAFIVEMLEKGKRLYNESQRIEPTEEPKRNRMEGMEVE